MIGTPRWPYAGMMSSSRTGRSDFDRPSGAPSYHCRQFRSASLEPWHRRHGRVEFHMAHEFSSAFQQPLGIGNLGPTKETDIDVCFEGIDVGECRITYTRGWMAIMQ